ncbi:uncharacterized protein LOC113531701 [Pangasianodon hypophthalmus]|uniref:uncharacterized protein LOC113531701 n=1 Tax=Pangasianodon hypophthalmus TaxID=310915 RepID=UPI00230765BF|nr:uncharacterized protein LOC113531701 [Pangasianodon hypophthalmus]XP_034169176.2 uncharacterized protein LOC113531701 [Pangasianodon hypophthalmus]
MQAYTQMPPVGLRLHTSQQTSCSMVPSPEAQAQYYIVQQNNQQSHGLCNGQTSSQPVSSSSNLQLRQMPQAWFTNSQNQLLLGNSACMRATLPIEQCAPLPAAQHGTPTQNLSHHPQILIRNTVPQQNYNMPRLHNVSSTTTVFWFPPANSNTSSATEQNNLTHRSVPPQYETLNGHHNRMQIAHQPQSQTQKTDLFVQILSNQAPQKIHNNQGQIRGGKRNGALYSSVNHFPATSQRLITPSQPSNYSHQTGQSHLSYTGNQVQYSSQIQRQPPPYRAENNSASYSHLKHSRNKHQSLMSNLPHPPLYTSQPIQRINQSSALSLPKDSIQPQTPLQQCNTIPVSGHHSKTCQPAVPDIHAKTQPQVLNNTITGFPRSSQVAISSSTPTSEAPPPIYTESTLDYSRVTLMDLLVKDNTQVPAQRHGTNPLSHLKCNFTTQGQTPSHITTKASYSQTPESAPYCGAPATLYSKELQTVSEYQTPVKRTAILKENEHALGNQVKTPDVQSFEGMQSRRLQTDLNTERKDGHKSNNRHEEGQYSEDITKSLDLVMALQKVVQQSHKAVAVVPPISQQAPSPEKKAHVTTSSNDSLPFKIDAVWTLKESKNMEQESTAMSLPKETTEELLQLFSVPHSETQERNKHEDGSTVDSLIPDTQSTDIPQSKIGSTTSQGLVSSTALISKSPEDHNKVKTGNSNGNIFDLSQVQVLNFTLDKFNNLVKVLERILDRSVKDPVADLEKCLLDLYWDGSTKNIEKQIHTFTAEWSSLSSEVSIKEMQTAVFQYLKPKDLKMLVHGYHILKNDTNLPTEEFRSSWLNIDGQPADIENVLAEPILDVNLTDYALYGGFNTLNIYSESETSKKVIPATTDFQNDKMINKELANTQVCESKSTDKVSKAQEASKKQEDENLQKHQQQDVNLNIEESIDSNETADTLMESKSKTECEQVCRDTSEDITSSTEIVEQIDLSNDVDSSNDSQLIELSLLSSDDARTIFKEYSGCDLQIEPSQLCQDETKVSATPENESNDFCNTANQIKFTCPHVTDIDWDGEHFCPRCWEETPLLELDLEEGLFSPKGGSSNMRTPPKQGHHNQSCTPQSGRPDSNCTVLSESSSIADSSTPNVDVFEVNISEPDPNPSDAVESCSSQFGKSPVKEPHAPVCTESVSFTMPIDKQVGESKSLLGPELSKALSCAQNIENLAIPEQTKTLRDEVSPPNSPPCKKLKLTKITEIPAEDDLFTADIVTKKASSTKPLPSDHSVTPAEDGQNCKDEGKNRVEESKSPIKLKIQINTQCPQSGRPDSNCTVLFKSSSIADSSTPNVDVFEVNISEPDPNPSDAVESCSSQFGKSPVKEPHAPVCTESVSFTMPIDEQVGESKSLLGPELPKALSCAQNIENLAIPEQTKTLRDEVSPPNSPPCKKLKLTKITEIPAEDDLFTADIVTKKASSTKPLPSDHSVTPAEDGQNCKDEGKNRVEESKSPIKLKIQINTQCPQSGRPDPNMNVCSESSSNSSDHSAYRVNMSVTETDPNIGDSVQSCSSPSGKSPDKEAHGRVCSESVRVTMPIEKQVWEANSLSGAELPKALSLTQNIAKSKPVIPSQTKTSRGKVSPPRYTLCKKIKITKTTLIPAEDDLFTPDIVIKKESSPKPHPSALNSTPTEDGRHCTDEGKERGEERKSPNMLKTQCNQPSGQTKTDAHGKWKKLSVKSQVPNVTPQPKRPSVAANSDTNKEKVLGKTKQTGQNKGMKKMRFALYGFSNSNQSKIVQHQCYNRTKSTTAPAYVTIANSPETAQSYTDALSAKQKVYSQWSSTFVETKKNTSSHKKHQKHVKNELKSRTEALKRLIKDRLAIKDKQITDGTKHKQSTDFVVAQELPKI